ncbi:MAG: RQC domain-containing protein, partial [Rubripirellula sp.]
VMVAIERMVGRQRREDVYVRLPRLADMAGVDSDQLKRTLRELNRLRSFDYIPPFRGRAVHLVQRDLSFEQLEIDFEDLNQRKRAEFEKLEAVIKFARTAGCRQRVILQYFGEAGAANCGLCDRCQPNDGSPGRSSDICVASEIEGIDSGSLLRGIQVVLSGVTRMHGRFGKNMVAQMLCGSRNKKLQQWKLHQLSTYGLLSGLRQTEVVNIMDALIETGLLQQKEVDERRPTLHMTEEGRRVMRSETPLPAGLQLPLPLAKRLAKATGKIEAADVQTEAGQSGAGTSDGNDIGTENPQMLEMAEKLKRWRRKNSAALGIPAYRVLTNATIDRIAESCPTSREDLESISGVGPATMEQFGDDILALVASNLSDSSQAVQKIDGVAAELKMPEIGKKTTNDGDSATISASPTTAINNSQPETSMFRSNSDSGAPPELPTRNNSRVEEGLGYWTWRLFSDGYSESEVMAIRHCDSNELVSQLLLAIESGLIVDPGWITDEHGIEQLRKSSKGPSGGG